MKSRIFILLAVALALIICSVKGKQANNNAKTKVAKTILLDFGFKIALGQEEDFKTFKTYSFFKLTKSGKIVYIDTLVEYEFGDKLYPIALQTGKNKFELIFEINDRPNKNYLKRMVIKDDRVIMTDSLPTFISKATDLDNDGIKEYAGFWCYGQVWGESETKTCYDPILYYKIKPTGLQLDSFLTKVRNAKIYGGFYGFEFNEQIEMPTTVLDKFEKELKKITALRLKTK